MIWCFLSTVLFDCYDDLAYAATYCHPDRSHPMELGMVGFVDDSNGQTNEFMRNKTALTLPTIYQKLRHNAQTWADLLGTTGGALELSKCSCHLLSWHFGNKGDPVLVSTKPATPIEVTDTLTEGVQALTFLPPHTAHKTLGHYKEPAGTQVEQVRQLRKKSDTSTAFLWKSHLTTVESDSLRPPPPAREAQRGRRCHGGTISRSPWTRPAACAPNTKHRRATTST